jgi:hypothetical protein
MWANKAKEFAKNIGNGTIRKLASTWTVSPESLRALGVGFDTYAYTFPLYDPDGRVIGIRKRPIKEVFRKHSATGSKLGLFIPDGVTPANVQLVCEGGSDTAAALTLGFAAIGRPGTHVCADMVGAFASRRINAFLTIVADDDSEGERGAENLAEYLVSIGVPCRIIVPPEPYGDLRAWLASGKLTPDILMAAMEAVTPLYPTAIIRPSGFAQIPHYLQRCDLIPKLNILSVAHGWGGRLGPVAFSVLLAIETHSTGSEAPPRPSRDKLARIVGRNVRTVDRCLAILKEAGVLRWQSGRTNKTNEYDVDFGPCQQVKEPYTQKPLWKPGKIILDSG